ncbi:hypothetical protein [Pseudoplusia includens SNPV IE]|uniref:Uncharacterized protein n=2 Tax=Chrysodeixis includens nucleopolyhedrovirus TaxID=1207438 RepID=A0A1C8ZYK2_9ABAC|nr:hypothetical protein [Pseudoplusia includens SNPV IE]AOL56468.1 hypothetical protein [Chrysodeixis includens nucleopolyhedrovirus]AJD80722.1 hypothetical protein [Pseudoplusia includens SNPV IE]AOL56610.1 hypothetical protein [Chrysodeixis includens nucleopolyhedrovirus]AOL56751.1 hypothetical protein [Chrysodeixis includens nucleopolyhedrovirus]AOL56893.1 hypothetical protein [Chrysodeixis includens nucleopolyhedrovirus]
MYSKFLRFVHLSGLHEQARYVQTFKDRRDLQILNLDYIRQLCNKIRLVLHDNYDESENYDYISTDLIVKCLNKIRYANPYVRGVQMAVLYILNDIIIESNNMNGKNSGDDTDNARKNRKIIQDFFMNNAKNVEAINSFFELNNIEVPHHDYKQTYEVIFTDYQILLKICDDLSQL